ncbi:MAG: helical backbone metal receptor [Polyangiaceae bacterium]
MRQEGVLPCPLFTSSTTEGRSLTFGRPPQRIVSLVPSDTYSVVRLGATRLVGATKPAASSPLIWVIFQVSGFKNARVADILALSPDLVLANQEENTRDVLEALATERSTGLGELSKTLRDGVAHLAKLARVLGVDGSPEVKALIRTGYTTAKEAQSIERRVKVFAPIWLDPLMTINRDTFFSDMLRAVGGENVFADRDRRYPLAADVGIAPVLPPDQVAGRDTRYPRITFDEVIERAPELILLPDEPYAFSEEHRAKFLALDTPASKRGAVELCSGKDLCWPGAMAIEAFARLRERVQRASE